MLEDKLIGQNEKELSADDATYYVGSHANLYNHCLRILRNRGYKLRLTGELDENGSIVAASQMWHAESVNFRTLADNPIELLGIVGLYESVKPKGGHRPYWWAVEGPDIWSELLGKAFPETKS